MVLERRPLFSQAWVDGLKHIPESAMIAEILIEDPRQVGDPVYDPITDTWTNPTLPVIYDDIARVQPIRSDIHRDRPGDSTNVLAIRFSIPIANIATDVRKGMRVKVTKAELNPSLLTYVFYVTEGVDSSNPLEKTFHAVTDLEATWDSNG